VRVRLRACARVCVHNWMCSSILVSIKVCVCVTMSVCVREREREHLDVLVYPGLDECVRVSECVCVGGGGGCVCVCALECARVS